MKRLLARFIVISYLNIPLIILLGFSACHYPVQTEMKYNAAKNSSYLISKPIYFYINDKPNSRSQGFFTLYYSLSSNKYFIKLNWLLFSNNRPYIKLTNSLKFSLDDQLELLLSTVKPPKVTKISFEPKGIEEEAVYAIDRPTLELLSQANKVDLVIYSRMLKLNGYFMHKHSFNAFDEFLNKVDEEVANE